MPKFSHLHVHSQYSLLDGAADIPAMFSKAVTDGMPGIALTDHGNMFGAFQFIAEAEKINGKKSVPTIKPILGCEFYLVEDRHRKKFGGGEKDIRYHQLLLAKNALGYRNLVKLASLGFIQGVYGKYPRIDKELLLQYHEGLIATTCCLAAEVPRTISRKGEAEGEKVFKWWLDIFGEDYYVELQRHDIPEQNEVNLVLQRYAAKHGVKMIASNDSHYVEQTDFNAHDILLCVNTGQKQSTPTFREYGDDDAMVKGTRFSFYNDQFFFKNTSQMSQLFADLPEAIDNTNEIVDKVEIIQLKRDILLPNFPVPPDFLIHHTSIFVDRKDIVEKKEITADARNQWEFLKHMTYIGANVRYGEITPELRERIDFELQTIHDMGFAGYFLIVSDFIKAGREMGVFIGAGRGSAAGSVVAYCIAITNIEPLKYNLLFERFLNPERISMPDIDTDFDDQGRQKVIDYVVQKYGQNQVAQIVTYGTMAAKSSIKDVARVLDLDLSFSNYLTKLVPDKPGIKLKRVLTAPLTPKDGKNSLEEKEDLRSEDMDNIRKIREIYNFTGTDASLLLQKKVLQEAEKLEGSVRGTGIHAAGIIIAPTDLTDLIPVCTAKDSDLWVTQFEGNIIESAGVIKMDFLGLKNLTILKDALQMIQENHNKKIDIDTIPLDDAATFELYQKGETDGTFQFESIGMKQHLRNLKPDKFEDLIAMNALFRPGPIKYIPNYIARKHGREAVSYDLPIMEEILRETYGITVYQEQVMLLSQKLAGFSKGKADELRKVMGKKIREKLDKMKPEFITGGAANGHPEDKLNKIWTDWEDFASYAFNKSHSTCYAYIAYQTAYLKVHYPSEYMAALLTANLSTVDNLTAYLDECRRMGLVVSGPDVNESGLNFSVNKNKEIRFGLKALKGMGDAAADSLILERNENGPYLNIFDFVKRVNLRTVNKSSLEALAQGGAFDSFEGMHRAQFFARESTEDTTFLEKLIRFGGSFQAMQQSSQQSLFGDLGPVEVPDLRIPDCQPWSNIEKLKREKAIASFFISGHPLDEYRFDIDTFCNTSIKKLKANMAAAASHDTFISGIVSKVRHEIAKNGNPYGRFVLEDFDESIELALFKEDYLKYKHLLLDDAIVFVRLRTALRYNTVDQFEPRIQRISLLSDVMDEQARALTLQIPVENLTESVTKRIVELAKTNKGTCKLRIELLDFVNNYKIEMVSTQYKVTCSNAVKQLKLLPGVNLKIKT
ncbi:MAG: DNA polymerase III subunit alpha [Bacteroidota bacterium]